MKFLPRMRNIFPPVLMAANKYVVVSTADSSRTFMRCSVFAKNNCENSLCGTLKVKFDEKPKTFFVTD